MKRSVISFIILFITISCWSQNSIHDTRKNSIYLELGGTGIFGSANYDRILPVAEKSGIVLGISVGFLMDIVPEVGFLYGGPKNFIELNAGFSLPEQLFIPQLGYRYQGIEGFLFRIGSMYMLSTQPESFGGFPWFGVSFGYSFK